MEHNSNTRVSRACWKSPRREPLSAEDFSFLKGLTRGPTKANLPTPSIAHLSGDRLLDRSVYPDRKMFFADLAGVMREEIVGPRTARLHYLQMDEVPIAVLCDPNNRETVRRRGEDPEELIDNYIEAIDESIKERPANMTVCVHLCRGTAVTAWRMAATSPSLTVCLTSSTWTVSFSNTTRHEQATSLR